VTRLLIAWGNGNKEALDQLTPIVYSELHKLAESYLRREPTRLPCNRLRWCRGLPPQDVFHL
jgi:hypothetical protein